MKTLKNLSIPLNSFPLHPFGILKKFLPKGLFGRSLLILMMPLLIIQISLSYVFFDRHTETILRNISQKIGGNIRIIILLMDQKQMSFNEIQAVANDNMGLILEMHLNQDLKKTGQYRESWLYTPLMTALHEKINLPFYVRLTNDDVIITVAKGKDLITFRMLRKLFFSRTTPLVLIWTTVSACLLFLVASLFMRNQIRPIRRLAFAADAFGRGNNEVSFKPEGALEVRQAGYAFLNMRERVKRLLSERLEMLAGVSHDLRTPLTRLKLACALLKDSDHKDQIYKDVTMLQEMVEGFLTYARGGVTETELCTINLWDWIVELIAPHKKINIEVIGNKNINIGLKTLSINRCLTNLIVNSEKNAQKLIIHLAQKNGMVIITLDDDGPGIPEHERENVFKPFYKMDRSRNMDLVGVGLGLSVARDVVLSHGGSIELQHAPIGGLRVEIQLPL